jgi:hypothetical protein
VTLASQLGFDEFPAVLLTRRDAATIANVRFKFIDAEIAVERLKAIIFVPGFCAVHSHQLAQWYEECPKKLLENNSDDLPIQCRRISFLTLGNWLQRYAHLVTNYAIKGGYLTRGPCVACGSEFGEAHHPDYTSPLHVVWLCRKHHVLHHTQQRALAKSQRMEAVAK